MIAQVNAFTTGWVTHYRHAQDQYPLRQIDSWLRRKLRCVRLKQCKRTMSIAKRRWRKGGGVLLSGNRRKCRLFCLSSGYIAEVRRA
ncbi:group II intron maturase-specific domain-containing protein [Sphingopyxis sp.]|uniref:group II intron maturase-specific domain-containing protein n=1 Tax=Sphingopyxis sp. TaxID=1908224 RepID=UPI00345B2FC1